MSNKNKSYTSVMPYQGSDDEHTMTKSRDAARILTHSSTISHEKKKKKKPLKKGWGKIQAKTEVLMKEKHENKSDRRKSFAERRKAPVHDRRLRITAQIDEIRAEQVERLYKKDMERKKSDHHLHVAKILPKITIHPKSTWKQVWDIMILLLVVFSACYIPLMLAFPNMKEMPGALQAFLDLLFLIDFAMCFRTGYIRPDNEVEMDQKKILKKYLASWFAIDFAASFPLDYILVLFNTSGFSKTVKSVLRLLKLPRLLRLGRLLKFLARFKYAGAIKIIKFIFMLILIAHWCGCFFFFIMVIEDEYGHNTWLEHNVGHINGDGDVGDAYTQMLYSGFLMLIGEGMDMETPLEKLYGSLMVLVGTIVTAVIVGNVSLIVSNQNSTSFQYHSKVDMITDEMRALHLPDELQVRTLAYYDYLWNRHRTFDPQNERFTADLSPTLRKEILLHMNRDVVLNCDFFRDVSNECILRLVHNFKYAVFLAHDILAEEGHVAEELVFLIHGSATVQKIGRVMPVSLLSPGDYFGEKSLLMHHRNAVSVVASENCDTRVLERVDFEEISFDFPELKESVMKRSDHMDVTEYDKHTRRNTMAKNEGTIKKGLTSKQMSVLNQIDHATNAVDVDSLKAMELEPSKDMTIEHSGGKMTMNENVEQTKHHMISVLSRVDIMSDELFEIKNQATRQDEDAKRLMCKQEQMENQLFELNQKMAKLLELLTSKKR